MSAISHPPLSVVPTSSSDPVGQMIGGYRIEREIGRGATGTVYLATHPLLRTSVAVKVLRHEISLRRNLTDRLLAELRTHATIRNAHLAQPTDLVTLPDGRLAVVSEYVDGPMLEVFAGDSPMVPRRVQTIMLQLCSALSELHAHGLIHRDVSAQSVVVERGDRPDQVRLLELGWVKSEGQALGFTTASESDAAYMAPEQVLSESIDERTDVYALGILAYRLLTGRVPFTGPPADVMFHHLRTPPLDPTGVLPDLRTITLKAMAKHREDRFRDVGHLAKALQSCQIDPPRISRRATALFTTQIDGANVTLRFTSGGAFDRFQRYEISSGRLFIPGDTPTSPGMLRVIVHVPGRPSVEASATLLGLFDRLAAERHGIPQGFAVTLRAPFSPHKAAAHDGANAKTHGSRGNRTPQRLPVIFGPLGRDSAIGMTTNVSSRGVGISASHDLSAGDEIHLVLTLPTQESARCVGTVMWAKTGTRIGALGIRLSSADLAYRRFTRDLMAGKSDDEVTDDTDRIVVAPE